MQVYDKLREIWPRGPDVGIEAVGCHYGGDSLLLSVVNLNYGNLNGSITVHLPAGMQADAVDESLWGGAHWTAAADTVSTDGMLGLEVSLLVLQQS